MFGGLSPFYKRVIQYILAFVALVVLCRLTKDLFALVVVLYGIFQALSHKPGRALVLFLALPFAGAISPLLFPRTSIFMIAARGGMVAMTLAMLLVTSERRGRNVLPLGMLSFYIAVEAISSMNGYAPMVSYLKLLSFSCFIVGMIVGTRNLHERPQDLMELRVAFFAFACITIFGSILVLPFPSIAYYTSLAGTIRAVGESEALIRYQQSQMSGGMNLFTGVYFHSQALAPMLGCLTGWVFCDMVVVERRLARVHLAMLAVLPVLMYLTRSRLALLMLGVAVLMACGYCFPHMKLDRYLRGKIKSFLMLGSILLMLGAVAFEVKSQALTKWVRKTNDVAADTRSATEAFTETRMGAIDNGLYDFRKNPMLGMGFQVAWHTPEAIRSGWATWYSAPIEKSLLPMIVLGEGGIVGSIAFLIFLCSFFAQCHAKHYHITITLFVLLLTSNLAEGTFFSPNGIGGPLWLVTVVGGFVLDTIVVYRRNIERLARQQQLEMAAFGQYAPR